MKKQNTLPCLVCGKDTGLSLNDLETCVQVCSEKCSDLLAKEINANLSKAYDWLVSVLIVQKRWLTHNELWTAFPLKRKVTKNMLNALIDEMKKITTENLFAAGPLSMN